MSGPSADDGRNETELERRDRQFDDLLQELRVMQTGVQVLFGFLLAAPLTTHFPQLGTARHIEYFVTLALTGLAAVLLIAPTAYHRVLFRCGDKEYLVTTANRLAIAGLAAVALSMAGAMAFVADVLFGRWGAVLAGVLALSGCVLLWAILPLARRRTLGL
jgi:hypothetical protein